MGSRISGTFQQNRPASLAHATAQNLMKKSPEPPANLRPEAKTGGRGAKISRFFGSEPWAQPNTRVREFREFKAHIFAHAAVG
jgi:hypothetical protein